MFVYLPHCKRWVNLSRVRMVIDSDDNSVKLDFGGTHYDEIHGEDADVIREYLRKVQFTAKMEL